MTPTRRALLGGGLCWCSALALAACSGSLGRHERIAPGYQPAHATDEDELWKVVARNEADLKRSPNLLRDRAVTLYVRDVACRLAADYCPDIRVYVLRTPLFNASMYPNGMMQVWSGLFLRTHNEAQLAGILGHEIGHYLAQHTLQLYRDAQSAETLTNLANLGLSVAGMGAVANFTPLAALAGLRAFSREHEREADAIGLELVAKAGYRAQEVARIWENMLAESKAGPDRGPVPLFATHPPHEERMNEMRRRAAQYGDTGENYAGRYREKLADIRPRLFEDELRLGHYARTLVAFERMRQDSGEDGVLAFWTGEAYRRRDETGDRAAARSAYARALQHADAPPETWRSLGLVARREGDAAAAEHAFRRYLELAPDAADAALIRSYLAG